MANLQILLTQVLTGDTFNLSQDDIIHVNAEGTGSKVLYSDSGSRLRQEIVEEAPAEIAAMANVLFLVTLTEAQTTTYINAKQIVYVLVEGTGSKLAYNREGAHPIEVLVDEAVGSIRTAAGNLVTVTPTIGSDTIDLNEDSIELVDDEGSGAVIMYDQGGARLHQYTVSESKGNINKQIYVNAGQTVYAIDAVDTGAETFTLAAAHGDVTGVFANGKTFQVVDSTGNDATYTVASQSFGGGKTTITVNEDITDSNADGDILIIV